MVGLLDIAPVVDVVEVNGEQVSVPGISVAGIAILLQRYPILGDMLNKGISVESMFTAGPDAVAAIIAAGCGNPGNEQVEQIAKTLNMQTQIDLVAAIIRRTLPKGIGPFVESINKLMANFSDPADLIKAKIEQLKASPKPSKPSSDGVVTPLKMSGP